MMTPEPTAASHDRRDGTDLVTVYQAKQRGAHETREKRAQPVLVRFSGDCPVREQREYLLGRTETVLIGRRLGFLGQAEAARKVAGRAPSGQVLTVLCLTIACKHPWTSDPHVRLVCDDGRWFVHTRARENGARSNGHSAASSALTPGDCFFVGSDVFTLTVVHDDACEAPHPALASLHPKLRSTASDLSKIAPTQITATILGPTGCGKELVARAIHQMSKRKGKFIAVNCGGLPAGLVDSALSGHRRGAFTGAHGDGVGLVRAAANGTLFLDEIGDLPLPAQASLLRILQEREILPVGDVDPAPVDMRVVCATNRNIEEMVLRGQFRDDLWARLTGFTVTLPPLSERTSDLGNIIAALLRKIVTDESSSAISLSPAALRALYAHTWPHNIRELEQALQRAVALADNGVVEPHHLPEPVRAALVSQHIDSERLRGLLAEHRGNISAIARAVGKNRAQIRRWCQRFGLNAADFRR